MEVRDMASKKQLTLNAIVDIAGSIDPSLSKTIKEASKSIGNIDLSTVAATAAIAAATTAAIKFGVEATKSAADFEKQMSNVATLLDGDVKGRIAELSDEVIDVSNATGVTTAELTDGLYQVISAIGDTEDSIEVMEIAAKAAKAGNATTTDSINLLSAVTKAYGDVTAEANSKVADLAFETVKLGQTTFPELASSMQQVTGYSNTLGVSQEELFGVFATATGVTGETATVATQLKAVYSNLLKPTKQMQEALASLGYSSAETAIEQLGLQGTLNALSDSVGNDTGQIAQMFSSVEALNLVLGLTGDLSEVLTEKTDAMYDATGATNTAFEAQTDNLNDTIAAIKNLGSNFMTEVGSIILPLVKEAAQDALPWLREQMEKLPEIMDNVGETVSDAIQLFDDLSPIIAGVVTGITAFKVIGVVKGLYDAWKNSTIVTTIAQQGLNAALKANPIGLIVTGIGLAVAAGVALYKNWDTIMEKLEPLKESLASLWESIKEGAANVADFVLTPFRFIAEGVNSIIGTINGISIDVPDWVPGIGGETIGFAIPEIPAFASGGFTSGVSLAGEAGTEAVISFDPAYRSNNISYWAQAGRMLGALDDNTMDSDLFGSGSNSVVYDVSGLTFAPTINVSGDADEQALIQQLKDMEPELVDFIIQALKRRKENAYA